MKNFTGSGRSTRAKGLRASKSASMKLAASHERLMGSIAKSAPQSIPTHLGTKPKSAFKAK